MVDRTGRCLVLCSRHMGDAVIASGLVNSLRIHNPQLAINICGRPQLEEVMRAFGFSGEYIEAEFPIFGHHRRDKASVVAAYKSLRRICNDSYDYCINTIGDTRENLLGKLTGAAWNIAPIWERGHIFKNKITDMGAAFFTDCGVTIPVRYANFYDAMAYFLKRLGVPALEWPRLSTERCQTTDQVSIGIHPGASHASRHWPMEQWQLLSHQLLSRGYRVTVFGSPSERDLLFDVFGRNRAARGLTVVAGGISDFIAGLAATNVLIGMDSFSVHAAYALGVSTVVLNGSADPAIFTPPGGVAVSAGALCSRYPCYYAYPCQGTPEEYICVREIDTRAVLRALDEMIERDKIGPAVSHEGPHTTPGGLAFFPTGNV